MLDKLSILVTIILAAAAVIEYDNHILFRKHGTDLPERYHSVFWMLVVGAVISLILAFVK